MAFLRGEANFSTHGFIPILFSNKILAILDKTCNAFKCVNTDYEDDIENFGDIVRVRQFGNIDVNPYIFDQDLVYQGVSENYQDLVINRQDYWAFSINPIDIHQSDLDVLGGYADRAQVSVRNVVDFDIFTIMQTSVSASNTLNSPSNVLPITPENVFDVLTVMYRMLERSNALAIANGERPFLLAVPEFREVWNKYRAPRWTPDGDKAIYGDGGYEAGEFDVYPTTNVALTSAVPGVSEAYYPLVGGFKQATSFAMQLNTMEEIQPFQQRFGTAERGLQLYGVKTFHPTAMVKAIVNFG